MEGERVGKGKGGRERGMGGTESKEMEERGRGEEGGWE